MTQVSPLAPESFPDIPAIDGVTLAAVASGVKYQGRPDLMLALLAPGSQVRMYLVSSKSRALR